MHLNGATAASAKHRQLGTQPEIVLLQYGSFNINRIMINTPVVKLRKIKNQRVTRAGKYRERRMNETEKNKLQIMQLL